jgi:hypothetical protein
MLFDGLLIEATVRSMHSISMNLPFLMEEHIFIVFFHRRFIIVIACSLVFKLAVFFVTLNPLL